VLTYLWNTLIFNPLLNILVFIYSLVGNYGIAIIVFTIFIKLLTLPFTMQQQKSFKAQAALAPELEKIKKKYGDKAGREDREKMAQEQMQLYKKYGINPLGGCLPMLIPWPLFLAFYQAVSQVMTTQPEQYLELAKHLWQPLATALPVGERFLWMNLSRPDPLYILPLFAVVTTWVQQKMMTMPSTDSQAASMNQTMGLMMPLFTGWITLTFASGLGLYWVFFNVVGIVQQYFVTGWGQLAPYVPRSILRRFPGPTPSAMPPVVPTPEPIGGGKERQEREPIRQGRDRQEREPTRQRKEREWEDGEPIIIRTSSQRPKTAPAEPPRGQPERGAPELTTASALPKRPGRKAKGKKR